MQEKLLLIGFGKDMQQLAGLAKERGIYTILCDNNIDVAAARVADEVYACNIRETHSLVSYCQMHGIQNIISSYSDRRLNSYVKSAEAASLKCYIKYRQLNHYLDKSSMKYLLRQLRIPTNPYKLLDPSFKPEDLSDLCFPVVLKPMDQSDSKGQILARSPQEAKQQCRKVFRASKEPKIIAEEYNPNSEMNAMAWVLDGKVFLLGIGDRETLPIGAPKMPVLRRIIYPSRYMDEVSETVQKIMQNYVLATGQKQGPLSMQFFLNPDHKITVGEITCRFLNHDYELLEYCSSLSCNTLLLDYLYDTEALVQTLRHHDPRLKSCAADLYFYAHPGIIGSQQNMQELLTMPHMQNGTLFFRDGEPLGTSSFLAHFIIAERKREFIDHLTGIAIEKASVLDLQGKELLYQ